MMLVYLIAGEASGDVLGARLIAALRARAPDLAFAGIGGERMAEQGLVSLFPMRELALMGLIEVLPRLLQLRRRLAQTLADIEARRPALLVTIDSPGFTLRVARAAKARGIPVLHYVAPQLWAWREGRARKLPGAVDRILALLPFEPAFFARYGMAAEFVGHPVLESGLAAGDGARFRARHGLSADQTLLLVMPGSRRTEVARLLPIFGATLGLLPPLTPVVPLAGPVAEEVARGSALWPRPPILLRDPAEKPDAFAACTAGLIKSGTSSLECAVAGLPHVIAYRVHPLTAAIARRLALVRYASLVNLLNDGPVVPELLQEACTPAQLAAALAPLLSGEGVAAQRAGFARALAQLRPPGGVLPSEAAAAAVLRMLGRGP
ncbi:MAG: lipid-A-disaccharide synthase [Rhodovarius sp.]|nr:lipid-A-disaccharide synthase [Rhodovarius sp.]MDW8315123.1 lipid-A-disaccharide synthase [Rhodovarius sp.]